MIFLFLAVVVNSMAIHYKKIEELRHNDSGSLGTTIAAIFY
jgi:hypothetical protein